MEQKYKVAVILNAVIVGFGLICGIITVVSNLANAPIPVFSLIEIAMYLLICYYAFAGYKKPHGNLLRYVMFIFGLTLIPRVHVCVTVLNEMKCLIVYSVAIALISYMSGRLNKIEKNKYISVIILILLCYCGYAQCAAQADVGIPINFMGGVSVFAPAIMWIALCSAYFTRYLQHKEAGLADAPVK